MDDVWAALSFLARTVYNARFKYDEHGLLPFGTDLRDGRLASARIQVASILGAIDIRETVLLRYGANTTSQKPTVTYTPVNECYQDNDISELQEER